MRIRRKGNLSVHIYYVKHANQVAFFMIPGKDAPLLPSYVIQIVDTALSPPVPPDMEVRVLSINALISLFAKHPEIEIASEILPAFQSILFRINSMACNNDSDEYTRNRTRQIALTGLKSLFSTRIVENLPEEDRRKALTVIIVSLLDNLLTDSNKLDVLQHQVMPNLDYSPVDQLIYDPEKQEKVNIDEVQLAILSLSIYRQIFINITNKSLIEEIITPALDSLDKNKRWREVDWLNWMMENVLMWTPIQFRYLIPLTVLKLLLDSKETFPTTTKQSGYLHILAHLFSREDPVSGIQVMDIVEKLIEFAQYRFIIDNQDALAPMSINTLSKLATHTYYSDQIADMSAKIIDQMTTVQFHEKGNVRDDLLRLLLSSLSGILAAAYDGPATDIPSTPQETETPPYSPKGKEKAVIIPKLKVPVSNKRTRVSPLDWQRTVSLLIEPNYGVRVAYVRALAGFIEGELNLADTSHEVMFEKFVNALNASIYTLAICRNLADTNIIEEAEGTAHIDNSLSRLKKVAQMTHTKPSLPSNTATPSDFSALLSIIVALHRRDICQALLILVPFLRALDNHAIQLMLGPGLQSSGSRRGSFASWAASPSARSGLNVGVDERAKCKAIRELVARSWYEIGDRWGNERIKQLASDGLNRIGITLLSQPTQIDVREQPMFGLQTPQAMLFPSEDDWDQVHDGESSKTGRPIVDELKAIDVIVNDPSVIAATGLTKAELLERLQLEWTFERAVDVASKETYNKFVTDDDDEAIPQVGRKRRQPMASASTSTSASVVNGVTNGNKRKKARNASPQTVPLPVPCDDKEGHLIIIENSELDGRYRIQKLLGQGTFGKVVECYDRLARKNVAVKIIKSIQKYRDASRIELRVLNKLRDNDPSNLHKCIEMIDWFDFKNHICIVSDLLSESVYDFLKSNKFTPFPLTQIQEISFQLLKSVAYLHSLGLIHTDLKPENILLVSNKSRMELATERRPQRKILMDTDIRLIDFGSATFENEYHSSVVSTRHYRAPEIILGLGWSYPCDVFSLGCIIIELITGEALFQTHDNLEHLAMMEIVMGKMSEDFARRSSRVKPEFFRGTKLDYPNNTTTKQSKKVVKAMKSIDQIIKTRDLSSLQLIDLLQKMLTFDQDKRIKISDALQHPYFKSKIFVE
ncbi:hypothetical protein E3Q18_03310 [Wallemia mellicola]|nr:hypothetical protein E3Q19_03222 [Wallemia mellicola]TIB96159.1 hypothetical protein E3Q18_03310 [Wallemia mellicola]TIC09902.1 hypothetical protein E3Q15_03310 [Wallemia mellicola]TIC26534.1 hypothetical protein E3Q11_03008 [Wallemia mellicola]TIC52282.1 hypothetical protein E3Q05_02811 [Wallemia mellicola]